MSFLDNSGDIILDAVLTDTGRYRLAKGDGSFKIVKFALGDDEINYANYRNENHADGAHSSGSAYYDLEILQTPILEAFTNNTSLLKSKLLSIPRTNLLYLPILKLNFGHTEGYRNTTLGLDVHFLTADKNTWDSLSPNNQVGMIQGTTPYAGTSLIVDQGLDTTEIPYSFDIDGQLKETQYIVEMDDRLCQLVTKTGNRANVSTIDDDNVASYHVSIGTDVDIVTDNVDRTTIGGTSTNQPIQGPRGSRIQFKLKASNEINVSTFLFTRLGSTMTISAASHYYIDTVIRITAATTGYRIDVPVRIIKKV